MFSIFISPLTRFCILQWSVLLPVVSTLIATQQKDGKILKAIANLCYSKWALQALVIANAERYNMSKIIHDMFRLTYLSLYTSISTYETVCGANGKQLMMLISYFQFIAINSP